MRTSLKSLIRQTLVYGTGNILSRLITFLLLPILTHALLPEEYGIVTLVYVFLGFMNIVYQYGLEPAFLRFCSEENKSKSLTFSTAFWLSMGTSITLSLLILSGKSQIAQLLLGNSTYQHLLFLSAGILLLDALSKIPFALLRFEEKPSLFITIKLLNVITTLGLNIWLVVIRGIGIIGVFQSVFLAAFVTFIAACLASLPSLKLKFSGDLARKYIKFGLPFVPAGLAAITMEMIDRYLLLHLTDTATVGIYSAGYKLGIFMLLITTAFNYAWQPFFLKTGRSTDAAKLYSKIFTYFSWITLFVWVSISAFIPDIIRINIKGFSLVGANFYTAESIVPVILLAYVFQGFYLNFLPGIYFEKKTRLIPLITSMGAFTNIVLNLLFIPIYGMMGAAVSTLIGYIIMAALTFLLSRKLFDIPYDWWKIIKLFIIASGSFFIIFPLGQTLLSKLGGILFYLVASLVLGVLSKKDFFSLLRIFQTETSPS